MDCQTHEQRLKEIEAMLIGKDEVKAKILERLGKLEARIENLEELLADIKAGAKVVLDTLDAREGK